MFQTLTKAQSLPVFTVTKSVKVIRSFLGLYIMFNQIFSSTKKWLSELSEFQSRVWVVHVKESRFKDESFVICEDNFKEHLEWMKRRDYTKEMLESVEQMKPSQVRVFKLSKAEHQLMRVK